MAQSINITVRRATESDIPAILALHLTSFRQFPLISLLYSPLYNDKAAAHDAVFFWRRRLFVSLQTVTSEIVVAVVPQNQAPQSAKPTDDLNDRDEIEDESWRMLDWCTTQGKLSQVSTADPGQVVVGFAIWKFRDGEAATTGNLDFDTSKKMGLPRRLRASFIGYEEFLWKRLYKRKDLDHDRYTAYLAAEEDLSSRFYKEHCYYLDKLCVDFRCHRKGIGARLVEWGIERARSNQLPIQTEASPKGLGLYMKLGFKKIGTWAVNVPRYELKMLEIPVLRLETTSGREDIST